MYESLLSEKEKLDKLYCDELNAVSDLQELLLEHVVPNMVSELEIDEPGRKRISDWATDTPSVFRVLKRHKFVASFALEDIRQILLHRLEIVHVQRKDIAPFLRCVPLTSVDPFGRPIVIVTPTKLQLSPDQLPHILRNCMEALRVRLQQLNFKRDVKQPPVLQHIVLLDMEGMSVASAGWMETVSTFAQQILPAFPGMLAAVFVLNYTWQLAGAWKFAKRLLPPRALSRVLFPSREELLGYLTPACLPSDYGGLLDPSWQLEDPLRTFLEDSAAINFACDAGADAGPSRRGIGTASKQETADRSTLLVANSSTSPTPHISPYYGYPVLHNTSMPTLRHGRRRKRDLVRTLARLFWARWYRQINAILAVVVLLATLTISRRTRVALGIQGQTTTLKAKLRRLITTPPGIR
ncbi:CRAL/TRIO domain-containing protein [Daedalea quercina L-15889]|uniref:CRAL/TRIO domain-containing protein n=1 Tax=Daedalea quercina L-15889 TaxID=1314783 RepID=A0A165SA81_9APHY|nr:CRAL/TRIO domain-containing protein [Daedalea quercina L-15889]